MKPLPSSPMRRLDGHAQVVVEHLAGHDGVAADLGDRRMSTSGRCRSASSSVIPSVRLGALLARRRAHEQQHISHSGAFVVHTLRAVHDVLVAVALGAGA